MPREEEKLKYIDFVKNMDKLNEVTCNQCSTNKNSNSTFDPVTSATNTFGFYPTNRSIINQNVSNENNLIFSKTNTLRKEMVESDMPSRANLKNIEAFGSINSNEFNSPESEQSWFDANNDVMRGIIQEYDRVKDRGEFYTFKSTPRKQNIDLSKYMSPPAKQLGRGFGNVDTYEKLYLGEQTRKNNQFRALDEGGFRMDELPYYLTAMPVFKNNGGEDTRFLNFKQQI